MTARKTTMILAAALALVASLAFATNSMALRAFTCRAVMGGGFSDSTCSKEANPGTFGHVSFAKKAKTELALTLTFKGILKATIAGVPLTIDFEKASGTGTLVNEESGGEEFTEGTGTITFEEATVATPSGKGCEIEGGQIVTEELDFTTLGQGKNVKFAPATSSTIAHFKIKGCSTSELNKEYKVEGSVKGPTEGDTVVFTHAATTEQGTLKLNGVKAGWEFKLELLGRLNNTQMYNPISWT